MKEISDKINLLFKPFILNLIGLIICYTFIHWLLSIKFNLFSLKNIITNLGIPIVLTGIVVRFIVMPKIKILKQNSQGREIYSFIVWLILTIPLIIAQEYLLTATGKLTNLTSINEINNSEPSEYYTLQKYYISKSGRSVHSVFEASGKYNQHFNMGIYIALPIFESEKDTINEKPFAWFGVEYNRVISNNLEPDEKKAKYQEFANKSQKDFDNKNIATFIYLERIGNSDDKTAYLEAIRQNTKYKPNETIFIGKEEPYELRNGKKLEWLLGTVIIGSILWLLMILIPKINEKELKRIKAGKPDKVAQKEMRELIDSLKPKEGYYITSIIIYLNIGIFIVMAIYNLNFISFNGTYVLNWGANFRPITTNGQWWRLLTNTFLHGGFMHLLANVYGLLFVGIFLEPLLGKTKYLLVYLTTGVLASIASIWWYEATISVGASGAIFGLYGFFLSILLKVFSPKLVKGTLINILIFIGFNLMMGFTGGVDNAAHIGGLVSGFVLGLIMSKQLKQLLEKQEKTEYD